MQKTIIKSQLRFKKSKAKPKKQNTSVLPPNHHTFRVQLFSGNGLLLYKWALKISN